MPQDFDYWLEAQVELLCKLLIVQKLELAKPNPFRYKALRVPGLTKVFEIKLTLAGLYSRIVYTIQGTEIRVDA